MIRTIIALLTSNYFLTLYLLGFIAAAIALAAARMPLPPGAVVEALFSYHLLFAIGLNYLANFLMHVFFGPMASKFIGWEWSPFEVEVGFASLGFAVVAILAFRGSYGMRAAAVIGPAMFLLGAAAGHVYQMVTAHNFSPGNAGVVFWMDIITPLTGFLLLWLARPQAAAAGGTARLAAQRP
jgi:hypothetical protein